MLNLDEITTDFLLESTLFYGGEGNPLLAPRGVWMVNGKLLVADTGQNRVFIWNNLPQGKYQEPDVTLGQTEAEDTKRNSGESVSASSLHYPSGLWSDGKRLIVADAWNHRVLIWNQFPHQNGQPADVVLGQPDFNTNQPNVKGVGNDPTVNSLNWPYGVFSDGVSLWIADTGNRRVLYYEEIPTTNHQRADGVIGKDDFSQRDYENNDPIWPYSVRISEKGEMAITDTQYYRVLLWDNWKKGLSQKADTIIGQENFEGNGQNQYRLQPAAFTLNWCYDSFFHKNDLYVADSGNSRVLRFSPLPQKNSPSAHSLIGHDDFGTGSENSKTMMGTANALYWPFSICIEDNLLAIADTGNHRVVLKKLDK
ncbi:hypothetical protein [Ekhidna sp.]|uniref:hypothetical protein n=1 Tax=Ekhidna sp. TaxID=2608089 RepID=UPI0032973AAA